MIWEDSLTARFWIGRHWFEVGFREYHEEPTTWQMWWRAVGPVPQGTGLFRDVNEKVKEALAEFLRREQPRILEVHGDNARANSWMSEDYKSVVPSGYKFELLREAMRHRADRDGVTGVLFRRLS